MCVVDCYANKNKNKNKNKIFLKVSFNSGFFYINKHILNNEKKKEYMYGYGRGEIRTPGSRVRTPRLKPGTLNHSVTRPL